MDGHEALVDQRDAASVSPLSGLRPGAKGVPVHKTRAGVTIRRRACFS